jgi:hypothetical protein
LKTVGLIRTGRQRRKLPDVWYSRQIAKMDIANGRSAEKKLGGFFSPNFRPTIHLFSLAFPVGVSAERAASRQCTHQPSR